MFGEDQLKKVAEEKKRWKECLSKTLSETSECLPRFTNTSDIEIKGLYTPEDIQDIGYTRDIGFPGVYSFSCGVQPSMYRGRLWAMRMFSGFWGRRKRTSVSITFCRMAKLVFPSPSNIPLYWAMTVIYRWPGTRLENVDGPSTT